LEGGKGEGKAPTYLKERERESIYYKEGKKKRLHYKYNMIEGKRRVY